MSDIKLSDYEAAKKSLSSTLRKIENAIVSLEEKQAEGKNLKAQIILSKERVKALSISLDLIEKEITNLTKI
ncbi:hypothetical protein [Vagococcus fluvialis]|uniref:hypothetical protein n=1 Tax=Vagococcus fluvialis TaxID=2738 RepID=UPI003B5A799A